MCLLLDEKELASYSSSAGRPVVQRATCSRVRWVKLS
jgi:hypothetical protein